MVKHFVPPKAGHVQALLNTNYMLSPSLRAPIATTISALFEQVCYRPYPRLHANRAGSSVFLSTIIGAFIVLLVLLCVQDRQPINLILLFTFTLLEATSLGFVCAMFAAEGLAPIVSEAFAITSIVFIGLTIFTLNEAVEVNSCVPYQPCDP